MRRLFALSFLILCCLAPAQGASQRAWLQQVGTQPMTSLHRFWWAADLQENRAWSDAANKSRLSTTEFRRHPLPSEVLTLAGDQIVIGDQRFRLSRFEQKDKKAKYPFTARFVITSDRDQRARLHINQSCSYVAINQVPATSLGHGRWSDRGNGLPGITLKKGENILIVVSKGEESTPCDIRIAADPGNDAYIASLIERYNTPITKDSSNGYRDFLFKCAEYIAADGGELAQGFAAYADYIDRIAKEDPDKADTLRDETGRFVRDLFYRLRFNERARFILQLQRTCPSWVVDTSVTDFGYLNQVIEALAYAGHAEESLPLIRRYTQFNAKRIDSDGGTRRSVVRGLQDRARVTMGRSGDFGVGLKILDLIEDWAAKTGDHERSMQKRSRDDLDLLERTKMQLNFDPEASQHYFEFRLLTERGADDEAAIGNAFSLFRKAGSQMRQDGMYARGLQTDLDAILRTNDSFRTVLRSHAQERLASQIDDAINRGDLETLDDIIVRYRALIDTTPIHLHLMRERLDRGDRDSARHHAVHLLNQRDDTVRSEAMATLMIIEKQAGQDPRKRTALPDNLSRKRIQFRGQETELRALEKELWSSSATTTDAVGAPGSLIGMVALPDLMAIDQVGTNDISRSRPIARQPLEPALIGERIMLSTPLWSLAIDPATGKQAWRSEQPLLTGHADTGFKQNAHMVVDAGNAGIVLRRGDDWHLRAFAPDGRRLWNSSDHQISADWLPYTTPIRAFGSSFVLVKKRRRANADIIALARLDTETGRLSHITPIDQLSDIYNDHRMLFDQHFCTDDEAIYGYSGSGAVFRIDVETLRPVWIAAMPLHYDQVNDTPAGYINVFKKTVVAYLPSIQSWVGMHSGAGDVIWRFQNGAYRYIHSRGSNEALVISGEEDGQGSVVMRLHPNDGSVLWRLPMNDLTITGSGSLVDGKLYIPTDSGIAVINGEQGTLETVLSTGTTVPNKVRVAGNIWCIFSEGAVHLLRGDGSYQTKGFDQQPPSRVPVTAPPADQISFADFRQPSAELRLRLPFQDPQWRDTGIPGLHLMIDRDLPSGGLLREGYDSPDGTYHPPELLWQVPLPNAQVDAGRILTYNRFKVEVLALPDLAPIYRFGSDGDATPRVDRALLSDNLLMIQYGSTATLINLKQQRAIGSCTVHGDVVAMDDETAYASYRSTLTCYDWKDGAERWQVKTGTDNMTLIDDTLVGWSEKNWRIYDTRTGKHTDVKRSGGSKYSTYFAHNGKVYTSYRAVLDIKRKQEVNDVKRVLLSNSGALELRTDKLIWHDSSGDYDLPALSPEALKHFIDGRGNKTVRRSGQHLLLASSSSIRMYDLTTGKRTYKGSPTSSDRDTIQELLDHSILISEYRSSVVNILRQRSAATDRPTYMQICSRPTDPDDQGWPQTGWIPPTAIDTAFWMGKDGQKPARTYATQLGVDDGFVYFRLQAGKSAGEVASDLHVNATWMHSGRSFTLSWAIDTAATARITSGSGRGIDTWTERNEDGSCNHFIRIDRSVLDGDRDDLPAPRFHLRIIERDGDDIRGWYRVGGLTTGDQQRQPLDPLRRIEGQSADNYAVRERLYSSSTAFVPQGSELARWLQHRRAIHGSEGNLAFLTDMAKRTKDSWCVTNVLAAMVLERIEQLRADPKAPSQEDPAYIERILAITKEVDAFGAKLGINADWRKRACSLVSLLVYPTTNSDPRLIDGVAVQHGQRGEWWQDVGSDGYICGPQNDTYMMLIPLGLFDGSGKYDWQGLRLNGFRSWTGFSHFGLIQPERVTWWIHPDGAINGITLKDGRYDSYHHVRKEPGTGPVITIERPDNWWVSSASLPFGEIDTGVTPENSGIDADNLLLTLKNLPTDSRIAINIIDSYRSAAAEDPDRLSDLDCYRIALARVGGQYDMLRELVRRVKGMLDKDYPGNGPLVFNKLHELMTEADISRSRQRWMNQLEATLFRFPNRVANLGPVRVADIAEEDVLPESQTDPLARGYRFADKDVTWSANQVSDGHSRLRDTIRGQKETMVTWHAARFHLSKPKKIFVYTARDTNWRHTPTTVDVSIDGLNMAKDVQFDRDGERNHLFSARLDEGDHVILFKVQFRDDWDFRCHIGDSWGVPLENLEWQDLDIR